ncbi:hypothetical protein [Rhizobium sp. 'Codium 1']|nr:hypothetical protein [Rhizobium sp. 'Codium 1']MCC8934889.1 hypothetical protein [Rhizobium sp. 'Codium 1']
MVFNTLELLKTAVAIKPSSLRELCQLPEDILASVLSLGGFDTPSSWEV